MFSELLAPLDRPVFLTGCGRSGTTILGTALARHAAITYLNEPRQLWIRCYPETDVWSSLAARRGGRLALDASVCTGRRSRRLRALFAAEVRKAGRPRLLEKLPINSFRLPFIAAVFPDAFFLHLVRNGLEVAASIARECVEGSWYGESDYKWRELVRFAERRAETAPLPALCRNDYERGLLEWRLSVETARAFYAALPPGRHLEVRYEALLADPARVLADVERFIDVAPDAGVHAFGVAEISRRSPAARPATDEERRIAGPLLDHLGHLG
jgi:sulfotransferase family protein